MAAIGDSKTRGENCCVATVGYRTQLFDSLTATGNWRYVSAGGSASVYWNGVNAATSVSLSASLDAWLAGIPPQEQYPDFMLVNIGANDLTNGTSQANYEASMGSILDRLHTAWPTTQILVMRPWRRSFNTQADNMAGWIATVLSTRGPWAAAGPDERIFLKAGDDGVTYTDDGIHPNSAGYTLTAAEWQAVMGY